MRRTGVLVLVLAAGCSGSRRVAQPSALEHGGILARLAVKGRELPNFRRHQADQLYWARVNAFGDLDLDHPIETTLSRDGYVYVLDLPPGKYAPFAAAYSGLRIRFLARLDSDLRKQMTVEVKDGRLVFAGDALLRTEWEGVLAGLEHLGRRLIALFPPWRRSNIDITAGSPRLDRTPAVEIAAYKRARQALAGTLWIERVDERLLELGNPLDPATTGFVRKKKIPLKTSDRFDYVDTLNWGEPEKIPGGLQWSEPKERGKIVVSFVAHSSRTYEAQLERLKLAGSAEDTHMLYDVRIGSLPARGAKFTTYAYGKDALVGAEQTVTVTEALVLDQRDGYYLLLYRAPKEHFDTWRAAFSEFTQRLKFHGPPPPPEPVKPVKAATGKRS